MMNNKKVFTYTDEQTNEQRELCVRRPTAEMRIKSQLIYNKAIREAIDSGSILQRQLDDYATKLGLWNEEKRKQVEDLQSRLRSLERKLKGGANTCSSKDEAKDTAFEMRKLRWELIGVQQSKNDLYPYTAESYADDARTKYFVSACTLDNNTGKPLWKDYAEYLSQSESTLGITAMNNYLELIYDSLPSVEAGWEENKWLKDHGYVNDKFLPINKDGKLIDLSTGKLIDENGRYVDEFGKLIDVDGYELTEDGSYAVEYREFSE